MTINERIKYLRKEMGWNQKQLASSLGMTQSGVSYMEQLGSTVADSTIKTICSICNLNEEWLRYGTKPMYIEPDTFNLDDLVKKHGASDLELEVLKAYFELDPAIRKSVVEHFKSRLAVNAVAQVQEDSFYIPDTPEEFEKLYPPIEPPNKDIWVG